MAAAAGPSSEASPGRGSTRLDRKFTSSGLSPVRLGSCTWTRMSSVREGQAQREWVRQSCNGAQPARRTTMLACQSSSCGSLGNPAWLQVWPAMLQACGSFTGCSGHEVIPTL